MTPDAPSTVVVTGGTKGLGRSISLAFARSGYRVLSLYHADQSAAAALEADFEREGLQGGTVRHDVADDGSVSGVWTRPEITTAASLTLIHNAAAPFTPQPLHLLEWDDFQGALDVSLRGCWQSVRGLLRPMLKIGGGTVVSVLTRALSGSPPKGFAAYRAAKAAQLAFTESLHVEYGARGIRVFSVSPPFMETSMTSEWHPSLAQAASGDDGPADPARVAAQILAMVESPETPGEGENHDV